MRGGCEPRALASGDQRPAAVRVCRNRHRCLNGCAVARAAGRCGFPWAGFARTGLKTKGRVHAQQEHRQGKHCRRADRQQVMVVSAGEQSLGHRGAVVDVDGDVFDTCRKSDAPRMREGATSALRADRRGPLGPFSSHRCDRDEREAGSGFGEHGRLADGLIGSARSIDAAQDVVKDRHRRAVGLSERLDHSPKIPRVAPQPYPVL
jgi:hypothetical protein